MKANNMIVNNEAVSPVIGVMLMIVVTVILAAAVSSFSSTVTSKEITQQAVFRASASYSSGNITLEHMSGDTLYKASTKIGIKVSKPEISGYVNMSNATFSPVSDYLRPGDYAYISFLGKDDKWGKRAAFTGDEIKLSVYIGQPFELTVYDAETANPVWSSRLVMQP